MNYQKLLQKFAEYNSIQLENNINFSLIDRGKGIEIDKWEVENIEKPDLESLKNQYCEEIELEEEKVKKINSINNIFFTTINEKTIKITKEIFEKIQTNIIRNTIDPNFEIIIYFEKQQIKLSIEEIQKIYIDYCIFFDKIENKKLEILGLKTKQEINDYNLEV